jgi:hypothetical protein
MSLSQLLSGDAITIKLYFKNIQSISASEGSYVSSDTDLNKQCWE